MNLTITNDPDRHVTTVTLDGVDLSESIGVINRVEVVNVYRESVPHTIFNEPPKITMHSIKVIGATHTAYFNAYGECDISSDHGFAIAYDAMHMGTTETDEGVLL